jgi:hypothetical protein
MSASRPFSIANAYFTGRRSFRPTGEGGRAALNFQNLKTQCSFKLAELVETHAWRFKIDRAIWTGRQIKIVGKD